MSELKLIVEKNKLFMNINYKFKLLARMFIQNLKI